MCVRSEICPFTSYLKQMDLLTETLWAGPVPGAISLAAEGRCAQEVEAVVALVGHGGAKAEPVGAAGMDLPDAVLLVPGICTVDDCHGKRQRDIEIWTGRIFSSFEVRIQKSR